MTTDPRHLSARMSPHDPLCDESGLAPVHGSLNCSCRKIAAARADERWRIARAIEAQVAVPATGVIAVPWAARIAREPALRAGSAE